jgi:RHS repeat-associated protein
MLLVFQPKSNSNQSRSCSWLETNSGGIMFALKSRIEVVVRVALVIVMLFSVLAPTVGAKADSFSKENELKTTVSTPADFGKMVGWVQATLRGIMSSDARSNLRAFDQADSPTTTPTPVPSATNSETSSTSLEGEATITPELQATPTEQIPTETPTASSPSVDSSSDAGTVTTEIGSFSTLGGGIGSSTPQNGANILQYDNPYPDLFMGRVSYSLPIWTPPGRNGMAPSLRLTYSSGTANGVLGDIQAPWVGMGWNIDTVEIIRKITNGNCDPCGNGAYGYENKFMLLLNGTGYELIPDGTTPGRYHTKIESFLYIQLHNDDLGNNAPTAANTSGEWWEVVQRDGTRFRLGWNADSEQLAAMAGYPGAATGTWSSLGYAGHATDVVALRWRVDLVTDTHGNQMSFAYFEENRPVAGASANYDRASYIDTITYTSHMSGNPNPGYSVLFVRESRGGNEVPQSPNDWDDWDGYRLDRIEVKYGQSVVRTYDLGYEVRNYNDDDKSWQTTVLTSVNTSGDGTNAPAINFNYTDKENRANCGTGCQEWAYPRLESVSNGLGSTLTYTYGNDARPSTSWYNWRVESVEVADGVNPSPVRTNFAYNLPCYDDPTAGWCNASGVGELIGYDQVIATTKDFDGTTTLKNSVHKFYADEQKAGREYETQNQNGAGTILSQTSATFTVSTSGLPVGGYFTYASAVENFLRATNLDRVSRTEYEYATTTGNLTHEKQFDGTPTLYRQTDYEYVANTSPSVWILNTIARRTLRDANGKALSTQEFGYDGSLPGIGSPTIGELTLNRKVDGTQTIDTAYIYDTYGNLSDIHAYKNYGTIGSQPSGSYLTYSMGYDTALETYATSATNPLDHITQVDYDYGQGLPTSVTDPNHNTITTLYDGLGRPLSITYPGYNQPNIKYTYPTVPVSTPFAIQGETWDETANVYRSAWQIMDGLGRVIQAQSPYETEGNLTVTDTSYNALGLTLYSGLPRTITGAGGGYFAPSWGSLPHNTASYDALGRTTLVSYPDSSHESFSYSGLRITAIDRNSHQKVRESDAFGRLVKVEEYTGSSTYTLYATTSYDFDARNLLKQITDPQGSQTTINYNGFGRKISMSDPDRGNWTYTNYDVFGNLGLQTDARGCTTTVTYDDLNRPSQKIFGGPGACATTSPVTYTYDATTANNQGIGYRTGMSDGSGTTSWFYNKLGQSTNETHNVDSTNYQLDYTFDVFNRPLTQTLPSGEALTYGYNPMGTLSSLSGSTTYVSNVHYSASGQVVNEQLGNGLLQQYCYETNTLRVSAIRVYSGAVQGCETNPSNPKLNLSYSYQPNGNVSQMVDATQNETTNYTYDELDRLLSVSGPNNKNYAYNSNGNITSLTTTPTLTAVTIGDTHVCALTVQGGVKCWGYNAHGELGDGTTTNRTTPVDVIGLTSGVVAIDAGGNHTCALMTSGGVKCWGYNGYGQLGDGTTTNRTSPVDVVGLTSGVVAIAAGGDGVLNGHTCALTTSGGVKCWGQNRSGQLGNGGQQDKYTPVDVSGLTSGVAAIAAGGGHSCAVTTGGAAKCWGYNASGQLGDGTTTDRHRPVDVSGLSSGITIITAGYYHTCARTTSGGIKCWGSNGYGQLGDGTITYRTTPVNVFGLSSGIVAVTAGGFHTCALTTNGGGKCWGRNDLGQLGDGTTNQHTLPTNVSGLTSGVAAISTGDSHSCVVTTSGGVKCWGYNARGELGNGTTGGYSTLPVDANFGLSNGYSYTNHAVTSLASGETYTYDENGNMIERHEGGLIYYQTFDAENRMVSVAVNGQTTQFVYDGDGNLVKKIKPDGSSTIYIGNVYEVDKSSGGAITRTVTYYPAGGAMRIDGTVYYILKDRLGSAYATTDASGNVVGEMRYYAFGETRLSIGTMLTDRLFTGQRWIGELSIYHFNARFYSPTLARFLSADTIIQGIANPQNLNPFSYVLNNPIRYTDPTGHMCIEYDANGSPVRADCTTGEIVGGATTTSSGGGGSSGGDNDSDDITLHFDTRDICNYVDCALGTTLLGMAGTAADTAAFLINGAAALATDVAFVFGGPAGYGAGVATYKLMSFIPNTIGWMGFGLFSLQGVLTGENHVSIDVTATSEMQFKEVSGSFSISQDTVFSGLNDTLSLSIPEPNVATIWSGVGATYDVLRNPLAPALSSSPPILPTVIQPGGSMTYNAQTGSFTGDLSLFTPP